MSDGPKYTRRLLKHPWWHRFFVILRTEGTWQFPVDAYWCFRCKKIVRVGYLSKFKLNQIEDFPEEMR